MTTRGRFKTTVKNVDRVFAQLEKDIAAELSKGALKTAVLMQLSLRLITPKDTGEASSGWTIVPTMGGNFSIENHVKHIVPLNQGSSQQAPMHFIEAVALQYGRPLGVIVKVIE